MPEVLYCRLKSSLLPLKHSPFKLKSESRHGFQIPRQRMIATANGTATHSHCIMLALLQRPQAQWKM